MFGLSKKDRQKAQEERKLKQNMRLEKAKRSLDKEVLTMENTYCPIMRANCHRSCIHFQPALATGIDEGDSYFIVKERPRCKLWRR